MSRFRNLEVEENPRRATSFRAFTLKELLALVVVIGLLVGVLAPAVNRSKTKAERIKCVSNLKLIGLAYRIYATDNEDRFSWERFDDAGIPLEPLTNNLFWNFSVVSNELGTPKPFLCPSGYDRVESINWTTLASINISYFVNLRATETIPQAPLAGDSDLMIAGRPVAPGLQTVVSNTPLHFDKTRHRQMGTMAMSDGSVAQIANNPAERYPYRVPVLETNLLLFVP